MPTQRMLEDVAQYLPSDRRESVHGFKAPCTPEEYVTEYVRCFGTSDMEEAAELALRTDDKAVFLRAVQEVAS